MKMNSFEKFTKFRKITIQIKQKKSNITEKFETIVIISNYYWKLLNYIKQLHYLIEYCCNKITQKKSQIY